MTEIAVGSGVTVEIVSHVSEAAADRDLVWTVKDADVIGSLIHRGSTRSGSGADVESRAADIESHSPIYISQFVAVHFYSDATVAWCGYGKTKHRRPVHLEPERIYDIGTDQLRHSRGRV